MSLRNMPGALTKGFSWIFVDCVVGTGESVGKCREEVLVSVLLLLLLLLLLLWSSSSSSSSSSTLEPLVG